MRRLAGAALLAAAIAFPTRAAAPPPDPPPGLPPGPPPALGAAWPDFQVVIWQQRTAAEYAALKAVGVTAGAVIADRNDAAPSPLEPRIAALRDAGLRWYVENIATDFYASYHRWTPGKPVNWRFAEVRRRSRADPADPSALVREPSLSDADWAARIAARLGREVRANAPFRPLFYDLADEAGIGDLSAAVDFDFSAASLDGFRAWLRRQYPSLAALNAEWQSDFADWREVQPATTDRMLRDVRRAGDASLAPWADFKAWMDVAFADAVQAGTDAVHAADPGALSGLSGGQIQGWGGYDYGRLPRAVDVFEIYEFASNVALVRGLFPHIVLLDSVGQGGAAAHDLWRAALQGTRGVILWDDRHTLPDGPEWRGVLAAAAALRGPLGARLIAAVPHPEAVAVLYSQASFRIQWLLDRRAEGSGWTGRSATTEYTELGAVRAAFTAAVEALAHRGITPRFLTPDRLSAAGLDGVEVLVLPRVLAMSDDEAAAIRAFVARGGKVVANGEPATFDAHGLRRLRPALEGVARAAEDPLADLARLAHGFVQVDGEAFETRVLDEPDGGKLIAVQADPGRPGPLRATLRLPQPAAIQDLRTGAALGTTDRITLTLDPVEPTILAVR